MTPCRLCNDQEKKNEDDVRLAFDFTPEELVKSVSKHGCSFCNILLEGIQRSQTQNWSFTEDVRRVYARCLGTLDQKPESLRLEIYFVDDRPKIELEFFTSQPDSNMNQIKPKKFSKTARAKAFFHKSKLPTEIKIKREAILQRPSISGHPLSAEALNWVNTLINNCKKYHGLCRNQNNPQLPKRVLHVESSGENSNIVKLIENPDKQAPYIAISHCW
jgi:hypothetical protein